MLAFVCLYSNILLVCITYPSFPPPSVCVYVSVCVIVVPEGIVTPFYSHQLCVATGCRCGTRGLWLYSPSRV
jgi:hypothetical protein